MNKKTLRDVDLKGKRVVMRVDFNVPLKEGVIKDDTRIKGALPSIKYVLEQGGSLVLMSHLGRPDEKGITADTSLKPVAEYLSKLLGKPVTFVADCGKADAEVAAMKPGDIVMLENTRYYKEEQAKAKQKDGESDEDFKARKAELKEKQKELAKKLASYGDIYCNDAFGTAHRAHASTAGVVQYAGLPAVCGYLIQKEISVMGKALADPERPFVAILGGAKVSDKLNVIANLLTKVDTLIIGGGMAYTFLAAKGYSVGKSLLDSEKIDYCREMMATAEKNGVKLLLPVDTTVADHFPDPIDGAIDVKVVDSDKIPDDMEGLDIGPKTMALYADAAKTAKTVVWNGPMGVFENPTLAKGTIAVAQALADSDAISIVGGGDSAAACEQLGFADRITHISTGGGASLEFLEGKELPGIACLMDR